MHLYPSPYYTYLILAKQALLQSIGGLKAGREDRHNGDVIKEISRYNIINVLGADFKKIIFSFVLIL